MKAKATEQRLAECQRVIGYYFSDPGLLEIALTHSSLRAPDRECNERLEFLGDSILGLVITEELYRLLPDQSEGELTRIKSAVVSRTALLATSQMLNLSRYAEFARGVGKHDELPASVVANLVEAVIGAIYLDAGYYPAREFVLRHMVGAIDDELNDRGAKNYKSLLQHEVQQGIGQTPTYRTIEAEGPDHAKEFVVAGVIQGQEWGRAAGSTKKEAEQNAARLALEAWGRRGRGRRRRRRRRAKEGGAPAAASARRTAAEEPTEVEPEIVASDVSATETAPGEVKTTRAPASDAEAAPKKKRPRRRGRGARPKEEKQEPAPAAPVSEAPVSEAPVSGAPAAEPAATEDVRPRRRRRRARSAESIEPVPAAAEAPAPGREPERAEQPAPVEAPEKPVHEKRAEKKAAASSGFGAGIDVGDDPAPKRRRSKKPKKSVKLEAPARATAPVSGPAKKAAKQGGFGTGIVDD